MAYKVYKIFTKEVAEPFTLARVLSNSEKVGFYIVEGNIEPEDILTQDEVIEYIKLNHVDED